MNYQTPKSTQKKFLKADAVLFAPGRHIDTEILKNIKRKIFQIRVLVMISLISKVLMKTNTNL